MGANDAAEMLEVAKAECVRLERQHAELRAMIARIERTKDQIGTHSDRCYEYHVACLAVAVRDRLGGTE